MELSTRVTPSHRSLLQAIKDQGVDCRYRRARADGTLEFDVVFPTLEKAILARAHYYDWEAKVKKNIHRTKATGTQPSPYYQLNEAERTFVNELFGIEMHAKMEHDLNISTRPVIKSWRRAMHVFYRFLLIARNVREAQERRYKANATLDGNPIHVENATRFFQAKRDSDLVAKAEAFFGVCKPVGTLDKLVEGTLTVKLDKDQSALLARILEPGIIESVPMRGLGKLSLADWLLPKLNLLPTAPARRYFRAGYEYNVMARNTRDIVGVLRTLLISDVAVIAQVRLLDDTMSPEAYFECDRFGRLTSASYWTSSTECLGRAHHA